jgi:acid phosphatase
MRLAIEARGSRWDALSPPRRDSSTRRKRLGDKPLHTLALFAARAGGLATLICAFAGCGSAPAPREPLNLDTAKAAVVRYYESGDYDRAVAAVVAEARTWIEQCAAHRQSGERLAVVLDIDETLLSNYPYIVTTGFGYIPHDWDAWIARGEAPAIKPVRELLLAARRLRLDVFLITGRTESRDRAATEANLRREGMGDYTRLIMKPAEGPPLSVGERKAAARRALYGEGYTIIANLGDQESDLRGGYAGRTFKLPDPLYLTE